MTVASVTNLLPTIGWSISIDIIELCLEIKLLVDAVGITAAKSADKQYRFKDHDRMRDRSWDVFSFTR